MIKSIFLGIVFSLVIGKFILDILVRFNINQNVSRTLNERHLRKQGTPTMGGIIFILSTLFVLFILYFFNNIKVSYNILIIIFTFVSYAILGGIDDFTKIFFKNNKGLSIFFKFSIQVAIALIFFFFFIIAGNSTIIFIFGFAIDLDFVYGLLILFMLTGTSNAVNITDGLDGLCAGLCAISFFTYGIIAIKSPFIVGYIEIAIFCFALTGSLIGFLFFNFYPAKVFMGDLGSLPLGAVLCSVAIILKQELSLIIIGLIYILETLSSMIQIISIKLFNKKVFKKSPLHHHFEELGFEESDIIKIFYVSGLIFSLIYLIIFLTR